MFIHIREPDELTRIKNDFNCKTLLVKNDNIKPINSNDADKNVLNYEYDYVIDNSGNLEDLQKEVVKFVEFMELIIQNEDGEYL